MGYSPNNPAVYRAAFAGMLAGLGARLGLSGAGYVATMAAAFAQAVDEMWGLPVPTGLDLDSLRATCAGVWAERSPLASTAATLPGAYAGVAADVTAVTRAGTAWVVAQGIDPGPPVPPDPPGNMIVDALGMTPDTPSTQTLAALNPSDVLLRAGVLVTVPFNGAPSFRLGASLEALLDQSLAQLGATGQYNSGAMIKIGTPDLLTLMFNPGGSTVGQALIVVERITS